MKTKNLKALILAALIVAAVGISAVTAQTGALSVYVSAQNGDDSSDGESPRSAVRTITRAIALATPKSHIVLLDSGTYDTFFSNKSLTVEAAPGVVALIPSTKENAAALFYLTATQTVVLRGLTFTGGGPGTGILSTGGTVSVENCVVSNFTRFGIYQDNGSLFVKDTRVSYCGYGIFVGASYTNTVSFGTIEHCRLEKNQYGLTAYDNSRVTVRDSVASGNTLQGFQAAALTGWFADLTVENCLANGNGIGIIADNTWPGAVTVRVANSTVTGNTTGFKQTLGTTFYSRGNNTVEGNVANIAGVVQPFGGS